MEIVVDIVFPIVLLYFYCVLVFVSTLYCYTLYSIIKYRYKNNIKINDYTVVKCAIENHYKSF